MHHGLLQAIEGHPMIVVSIAAVALGIVVAVWVETLGQHVDMLRAVERHRRIHRRTCP